MKISPVVELMPKYGAPVCVELAKEYVIGRLLSGSVATVLPMTVPVQYAVTKRIIHWTPSNLATKVS